MEQSGQVLRRMMAHTQAPRAVPVDRAIATAAARAAQDLHGMALFPASVTLTDIAAADLPELLPDRALIMIVEGAGEQLGVVVLDGGLFSALLEMQTLGRIAQALPDPRRPTRTDAAMCTDFVNRFLAGLADTPGALPAPGLWRHASFLDDPRPLGLMLEDGPMVLLTLAARLGHGGARQGQVLIALPAVPPQAVETSRPEAGADFRTAFDAAVHGAPITVAGVLCRRKIGLGTLRKLAPGDLLTLPADVLDNVTLETLQGRVLSNARLGERDGSHALRLRALGDAARSVPGQAPGEGARVAGDMAGIGAFGAPARDAAVPSAVLPAAMAGQAPDADGLAGMLPMALADALAEGPDPFRPDPEQMLASVLPLAIPLG